MNSVNKWIRLICFFTVFVLGIFAFPGATEIDTQVFVINIGIDRLNNGMLRVTAQMPSGEHGGASISSSTQSSGEGQSGENGQGSDGKAQGNDRQAKLDKANQIKQQSRQTGYIVAAADGVNFADALNIMTATLPRLMNMSQVQQVIVSDAFARDAEFEPLIMRMVNDAEFYSAAQLVVCEGSAEEFIRAQELILGARLSKAQDAADYAHELVGFVPSAHISDIYYAMNSGYGDGVAALCATNVFDSQGIPDEYASGAFYAGQAARTGANLNEYLGSALFGADGMVGRLSGYETQLMHIMRGTLREMLYMDAGRTAQLSQRSKPRVSIDMSGNDVKVDVSIELYMVPHRDSPSTDEVRARMVRELGELIAKCQRMGVEPFGFGTVAVRQFATFGEWYAVNWRDRFASADVGVDVELISVPM